MISPIRRVSRPAGCFGLFAATPGEFTGTLDPFRQRDFAPQRDHAVVNPTANDHTSIFVKLPRENKGGAPPAVYSKTLVRTRSVRTTLQRHGVILTRATAKLLQQCRVRLDANAWLRPQPHPLAAVGGIFGGQERFGQVGGENLVGGEEVGRIGAIVLGGQGKADRPPIALWGMAPT